MTSRLGGFGPAWRTEPRPVTLGGLEHPEGGAFSLRTGGQRGRVSFLTFGASPTIPPAIRGEPISSHVPGGAPIIMSTPHPGRGAFIEGDA
jgi:hypothetical protein